MFFKKLCILVKSSLSIGRVDGLIAYYSLVYCRNCKANQGLGDAADGEKLFKAAGYNLTKLLDANVSL